MSSNYLILLPPSEGKEIGGEILFEEVKDNLSFEELNDKRDFLYSQIIDKIIELEDSDLEKVFDIKLDTAKEKKNQLLNLHKEKSMKTINRYSGVMFKAIDYDSLDENQKNNFDKNVIFISGLFGLLKPTDLIPDYKLRINAKISDLNIEKYWKEHLKNSINDLTKNKIVIDILPEAHRKVIGSNNHSKYFEIIFGEIKDDKFKQAGHLSKELKGELIRYLTSFDTLSEEIIKKFKHSKGYDYSYDLSENNKIVFLKLN